MLLTGPCVRNSVRMAKRAVHGAEKLSINMVCNHGSHKPYVDYDFDFDVFPYDGGCWQIAGTHGIRARI